MLTKQDRDALAGAANQFLPEDLRVTWKYLIKGLKRAHEIMCQDDRNRDPGGGCSDPTTAVCFLLDTIRDQDPGWLVQLRYRHDTVWAESEVMAAADWSDVARAALAVASGDPAGEIKVNGILVAVLSRHSCRVKGIAIPEEVAS